jgi:hypothetical protein
MNSATAAKRTALIKAAYRRSRRSARLPQDIGEGFGGRAWRI